MCISHLPKYMSVYHMCTWFPQKSKSRSNFLLTGVQIAISHHVGAGNQTQVLWKNNQCSYLLSPLSIPQDKFYNHHISRLVTTITPSKTNTITNFLSYQYYNLSCMVNIYYQLCECSLDQTQGFVYERKVLYIYFISAYIIQFYLC